MTKRVTITLPEKTLEQIEALKKYYKDLDSILENNTSNIIRRAINFTWNKKCNDNFI